MKRYRILLAKWRIQTGLPPDQWFWPRRGCKFGTHVKEVLHMGLILLDKTPFGRRLFEVMNLKEHTTWEEFRTLVLLAILCHDLGKAGSEFLKMLWLMEAEYQRLLAEGLTASEMDKRLQDSRYNQLFRHEWLSGYLLTKEPYKTWLEKAAGGEKNALIVRAAVQGHHIKTSKAVPGELSALKGEEGHVYVEYRALAIELNEAIRGLNLPFAPFPDGPQTVQQPHHAKDLERHMRRSDLHPGMLETPLTAAIKFVLIQADSFGSMEPAPDFEGTSDEFRDYLEKNLNDIFKPVSWHLSERVPQKYIDQPLLLQMLALAERSTSGLLISATGSGKHYSAFMFVADPVTHMVTTKLTYTAPTTGTTAQFLGVSGKPGDALRSSRSFLDKALWIAGNDLLSRNLDDDDTSADIPFEIRDFFAPVVYATPDQVLGVLSFSRKSIFFLLYLVQSTVVWDEFHSYDEFMSGWHRKFIQWFPGIPSISLSATVTKTLEETVLEDRPDTKILNPVDPELAHAPRFRFHLIDAKEAPAHFLAEKRTIWYANQVAVSQHVGMDFEDALVLHSQFRYADKVRRLQHFIAEFKKDTPIRAVSTQAGQMALDIQGDQGILEACHPADAIQRLGRLTPRGEMPEGITEIYIYFPSSDLPYEILDQYRPWYESLAKDGKVWSQFDLVESFRDNFLGKEAVVPTWDMFETYRRPLRYAAYPTTLALLTPDYITAKENKRTWRQDLQEFEIQIPLYRVPNNTPRYRHWYLLNWRYEARLGLVLPRKEPFRPDWH